RTTVGSPSSSGTGTSTDRTRAEESVGQVERDRGRAERRDRSPRLTHATEPVVVAVAEVPAPGGTPSDPSQPGRTGGPDGWCAETEPRRECAVDVDERPVGGTLGLAA